MGEITRRLRQVIDNVRGVSAAREPDFWQWLTDHPDAHGALISLKGDPAMRYRMQVGYAAGGWRHTDPQTSLLALGPPRSAAGKTAGIVIPTVLMMGGPVVTTSTKWDVARATALARSRLGDVWHFDPTGAPCPPGFRELRWSPVVESKDWNSALEISRQMMLASDAAAGAKSGGGDGVHVHFQQRAGDLLAAVVHYAALTGRDMGFVVEQVTSYDLRNGLAPIVAELKRLGATEASDLLRGIIYLEDRERSGVFSTASVGMRAYQGTARRAVENVNFDVASFVRGQPDEPSDFHVEPYNDMGNLLAGAGLYPRLIGRYDTVYISLPADKQSMYAPAVTGLLSAIKKAVYDLHREDLRHGETGTRQPVTFVLDEMYGAPLPDLPELLSEGGGQGLLICGALQDLSQAEARWGKAGEGILTLFQNVVAMPGIRHRPTLELLSMLVGDYDRVMQGQGHSQALAPGPFGFQRRIWMLNESETIQRQRILPPEEIYRGNPNNPREVLVFTPNGGWQHVNLMKYWAWDPWPIILTHSIEWALTSGRPENFALPLPELDRGGSLQYLHDAGGKQLVDWWLDVKALWQQKQGSPVGLTRQRTQPRSPSDIELLAVRPVRHDDTSSERVLRAVRTASGKPLPIELEE